MDQVDARQWSGILGGFADASIYQTWPYPAGRDGTSPVSHLLLKRNASVAGAAAVRLAGWPRLNLGMAYVFWGPLWKQHGGTGDLEALRHGLRALRDEYARRRGLIVRVVPQIYEEDPAPFRKVFEEEGYVPQRRARTRRTILVDLRRTLDELYEGLHAKWRYSLKKARKENLSIIEGEGDELFELFARIYDEMVERKHFDETADVERYRRLQKELAPREKMRVFLCKAEEKVCAGGVISAVGDTAIYLLGATTEIGMKTSASYLVHWRMLEWVRQRECMQYDLNGINPENNHGVYLFKSRLAGDHGQDVRGLGEYDAYPGAALKWLAAMGDWARTRLPNGRKYLGRLFS